MQPTAGAGRAAFNAQGRQSGLQHGDLLAELCSKPQQPGPTDGFREAWRGEAGEAVACTCKPPYQFPAEVEEGPGPTIAAEARWFGEGHHKNRASQSSTPQVPGPGLYFSAGEGLCWLPLCPQKALLALRSGLCSLLGPGQAG